MTILLSDPRVAGVPVLDDGSDLVAVGFAPRVLVRRPLAERLVRARRNLPEGVGLKLIEGYRSPADQMEIIDRYTAQVRESHPDADDHEVRRLSSRFVSPIEVAPHVAGAAVDLTLVDAHGRELPMGSPVDATPEESAGACRFDADVGERARANRTLLAYALVREGLVNYPTEWWHWSYGDRYWALTTGAPHALFGPVENPVAA
ncbi:MULTISPECIES: M15 family metallopeptidase [unclassified Nocardiopsis]|uniref:M15 family metallopeptidase n=1 Tax=Nocardiopsis TaxID=2013 RepID=UPI00387B7361